MLQVSSPTPGRSESDSLFKECSALLGKSSELGRLSGAGHGRLGAAAPSWPGLCEASAALRPRICQFTLGRAKGPMANSWMVRWAALGVIGLSLLAAGPSDAQTPACTNTITADVVALDQPFFWNRLGPGQPPGRD